MRQLFSCYAQNTAKIFIADYIVKELTDFSRFARSREAGQNTYLQNSIPFVIPAPTFVRVNSSGNLYK